MAKSQLLVSLLAVVLAALLSCLITWAIRPVLLRYAVAQPNARSSHRIPTPQGAGLAVVFATLAIAGAIITFTTDIKPPVLIFVTTLFIAAVGLADDIRSVPVVPRLLLQGLTVATLVFTAPPELRLVPTCPIWIERGLILIAGLWFMNLVNFMDGLDWMTVAETVPITAALILLGSMGKTPELPTIFAATLCGAIIGFAPFNRPIAKIFLGDVGSLPIGFLLGWCLLELAYHQQPTAALLLPMYYLGDATTTLFLRSAKGKRPWIAHRSHFYQRATDNGFTVFRVVSQVFAVNIGLAILATLSTFTTSNILQFSFLFSGGIAVALLMQHFTQSREFL